MPRIRREHEANKRELRVFIVRDEASGEYYGTHGRWMDKLAHARIFKRKSDAMNSLGYRSYNSLKDRDLRVVTLYPDYDRWAEEKLIVEETYYEQLQREKRERERREQEGTQNISAGGIRTRW